MGRKFASQGHLGLITWDGRVDSFESHVIQDGLAIHDQMDLHLGLRWAIHILGEYRWENALWVNPGYLSAIIPLEFHYVHPD